MNKYILFFTVFLFFTSLSLQHSNLAPQYSDFIKIIKYASLAPSGHNSQPWKFKVKEDSIIILPDYNKALPIVDKNNRELFISLGCATENLIIAASHFCYATQILSANENGIIINLKKAESLEENNLFHQIKNRQTNRSIYTKHQISKDILDNISDIHIEKGIHLYYFEIGTKDVKPLIAHILEGNKVQMNDKFFKKELLSWIRFNEEQIKKTQDGITFKAMRVPSLPTYLAKYIVKLFLQPRTQNKSDLKKINSSSHLVMITSENNTPEEWIKLGQTLQRFLLKTTKVGIANSYLNPPCEVELIANKMRQSLPIEHTFPTIILRIGYADPIPFSPRREIRSLIVTD